MFCLSIDSGAGTTKLMGKFIKESVGQRTKNIMLLAEAHKISESFIDLANCFGEFGPKIRQLTNHGITIDEEFYQVKFVFVRDFHIYYALFSISGSNSKFPCPWCCTPVERLDVDLNNLSVSHQKKRPEIRNFVSNSVGSSWQHKYTWNLLNVSSDYSENDTSACIAPAPP